MNLFTGRNIKTFFTIVVIFILSIKLNAQVDTASFFNENFDYTVGDSIGAHGWTSNTGNSNNVLVTNPGLSYTDYLYSGIGNAATLNGAGIDYYKSLNTGVISGDLYATFMVNVSVAKSTGDYFAAFLPSSSTTNYNGRIYVRNSDADNTFAFGLSKTTDTQQYTSESYNYGTTYLVIVKYTFVAGASNDEVRLFVFESGNSETEPITPTLTVLSTNTDQSELGRFALRQGGTSSAPTLVIDGIRASDNWGDASPMPVELSSFSYNSVGNNVSLIWSTSSEINNKGFEIERKLTTSNEWTKVGFVSGNGTTNTIQNYKYNDENVSTGSYNYRLKQIDYNGNNEYHILNSTVYVGTPSSFNMNQNYPNPFNPKTTIEYNIPVNGNVSLKIFDASGKEIKSLVNEFKNAGYYSINVNASDLSSGVYYYTIKVTGSSQDFSKTMKMMLIK